MLNPYIILYICNLELDRSPLVFSEFNSDTIFTGGSHRLLFTYDTIHMYILFIYTVLFIHTVTIHKYSYYSRVTIHGHYSRNHMSDSIFRADLNGTIGI